MSVAKQPDEYRAMRSLVGGLESVGLSDIEGLGSFM
jgi:hypothetical protein